MTAKEVPVGEWFMLLRTKQWYKMKRIGRKYVYATQIGSSKEYQFSTTDEVQLMKPKAKK